MTRFLAFVLIVALGISSCSSGSAAPPQGHLEVPSITGEGRVEHAGFTADLGESEQTITLAPPELNEASYDALVYWTGNGAAVGTPMEVELDGAVPEGGITLTRTYPIPVPEDVAVTFAYFDDAVGEWVAVPSDLSADRRSVSATVDHLSLWSTIVQGGQTAMQGFTDGLSAAGNAVKDVTSTAYAGVQKFNAAVQDAFVAAAEEMYYTVGKVFDVRVDPPVCDEGLPEWADSTNFIETDRNNPILWCAGHDVQHPELLVVKARVNRGYGSFAVTAVTPTWVYNSTFDQGVFDAALAAITELDQVLAQSVAEITGGGRLVGPGQEVSFGFSEEAARAVGVGQPLVTLALPDAVGFLATSLAQLVGAQSGLLLEGSLAAVIAVASCAKDFAGITDAPTAARAALTCLSGLDEVIARKVAVGLLKTGLSPQVAGRTAGAVIGKLSVGLAAIGPVFNAMNYTADSFLLESARTLVVFVKIQRATASSATEVITLNPFNADGSLTAGYSIRDLTALAPVDCSYDTGSPSAVTGGTHSCGGTADDTHSCWASPRYPGQLACMTTPWRAELLLRRATVISATLAPRNPEPLGIELEDGTRWWLRHGGSWGGRADGLVGAYGCDSTSTCSYERTGKEVVVLAGDGPVIDTSTQPWTVLVGELGDPNVNYPAPTRLNVRKAWFIASTFD